MSPRGRRLSLTRSASAAPISLAPPRASGAPSLGSRLTLDFLGAYTGRPTRRLVRWLRGGTPISGATGPTYDTVVADFGQPIQPEVTPGNAAGLGSPVLGNVLSIAAPRFDSAVVTFDSATFTWDAA